VSVLNGLLASVRSSSEGRLEIAQRLVVSEKTVHHHVSAVLRKLNARTRGEASAEALRLGLLDKAYVMAPSRPSGAAAADDQD
jgi:hypothetical protein